MISSILDNKEEIVKKIVEKTGLDKDEVYRRIDEKVKEYGGLLTEAGAAFALAKELGVDLGVKTQNDEWLDIGKLSEDLGFVNVVGVVKAIAPIRKWERGDRAGKVTRILLADSTGEIWVTLWNQDAELAETNQIKVGSVVGIKNGTIRKTNSGNLEINTGMRAKIIIDAKADKSFPEISNKKIADINEGDKSVNVYGRVERIFPKREFTTNGREGKVSSMIITDGTKIRVVAWGDNADIVEKLKPGQVIKIENASPKSNNGNLELHLNWMSRIIENPEDAPELPNVDTNTQTYKEYPRKEIKDLSEGAAEIRGTVLRIYKPTKIRVCPVCGAIVDGICPEHGEGKDTLILNIEIDDGTGVLRGVLFRELAERFLGISEVSEDQIEEGIKNRMGDELIFGGQVKNNNLFDRLEIHIKYFKEPNIDEEIKILEER